MTNKNFLKQAYIDCPICYSGNFFDFENKEFEIDCDDCGFRLLEKDILPINNFGKTHNCYFCFNEKFYFDKTFFGNKSNTIICYLCKAKYYESQIENADESFDPYNYRRTKRSEQATKLQERIKLYNEL